jgi:hypothetical protein
MLLRVINVLTQAEQYFDPALGVVAAVAAAYARAEMDDWKSWEYEQKFHHLVTVGGDLVCLGDWVCLTRDARTADDQHRG